MRLISAIVLLGACSGNDQNIRSLFPSLAVSPEAISFGEVGPPLTATVPLYVTNAGSADLDVTSLLLDGPTVFSVVVPPDAVADPETGAWAFTVGPDDQLALPVTFAPDSFRTWDGRIVIETNDEDHPRVVVPISGEGVDLPFGDIEIAPSRTIEAQEIPIGSSALMTFDIRNVGDAPLTLSAVTLTGDPTFRAQSLPAGAVIQPDQVRTAVFSYAPTDEAGDNALVVIDADDPDEPTTTVLLLGNGGGPDFAYPEAVIDCPSDVQLAGPEFVHLDGSESTDPSKALPLTFEWTVTQRPEASDADIVLDPDDTPSIDLYVDVAGQWTVQLVVANALGTESEPVTCTFSAIPEDDLHVELSWDTSQSDLDLHLVQGGSSLFDVPEDCNYCNSNPSWGPGATEDDPRLDIDDLGGFGPENINILTPEDGTYDVFVHYFHPHGDGPSIATVKVWLNGAEVYSGSRVLQGVDGDWDLWRVGTIDWPGATFIADPTANTTTLLRKCDEP